jgi:hypothetical protein
MLRQWIELLELPFVPSSTAPPSSLRTADATMIDEKEVFHLFVPLPNGRLFSSFRIYDTHATRCAYFPFFFICFAVTIESLSGRNGRWEI